MVKQVGMLLLVLTFVVGCGSNSDQGTAIDVTVQKLLTDADSYVDKAVSVTGTVVHVCRHSGKRLFVIGEDPEQQFKITTGPDVSAFDVALEGSDVTIEGIVKVMKVDEAFLAEWESELTGGDKPEVAHQGHAQGQEEHAEDCSHDSDAEHQHKKDGHAHDNDAGLTHADGDNDHSQGSELSHSHDDKAAEKNQIDNLRKQLQESGKDHLAFYSLEATSIREKKI